MLQQYILVKKPCEHYGFSVLSEKAKQFYKRCNKCGWKVLDRFWHLKPVKLHERWDWQH